MFGAQGCVHLTPTHLLDDVSAALVYFVAFFDQNEKVLQILEVPDFRVFEKQHTEMLAEQIDELLDNSQLVVFVVV